MIRKEWPFKEFSPEERRSIDSYLATAIWVSQVGAGRWSLGAVVLLVVGQHRENLAAHAAPEQPLCLEHARDSHLNHSSSTETEIVLVFTSATKYQLRIDFMYH